MESAEPAPSNGWVSEETSRWVLVATILASSMAFIDGTALNVALPTLQNDLSATAVQLLWIVNAYALPLAALILVGGALGDRYGRRRVFGLGIGLFALASLVSGLAPSAGAMIASRTVQGVGGAMMVPGSLSLITAAIPPARRGRAIGTWSAFTTVTTVLGPALGGFLADAGFWRGVFFINLPLAAVALYVLLRHVPESRDEAIEGPPDIAGSVLITLGLAGLAYAFTTAGDRGLHAALGDPLILITLIGGIAAIAGSVAVEARTRNPLMPLHLFRSAAFTGANLLTLFLYAGLYGITLFFSLNLVQVQGYRQSLAGLAFLPFSIMLALMSRWAGGLVDRVGPRLPLVTGPAIAGVGMLLFGLPGITGGPSDYWRTYLPAALVFGVGMGITVAPLTTTVMTALEEHYAGTASGINNAISRIGGVLSTAIFGALMLVIFSNVLQSHTANLALSSAQRSALSAQATNLGNAQVPDSISGDTANAVQQAIDIAFVQGYRTVSFIAAGLAWLSALTAALLIPRRLEPQDTGG